MCPITLTIVTATSVAMVQAMAAGAGIAASMAAATAAASAAATGAGMAGAVAAGAAASAAATATAAGVAGTAALTIGGAAGFGATGTALSGAAILGEAVAFAGLAKGVHEHKEAKRDARRMRKDAATAANIQRTNAANEAARATQAEAEQGSEDVKETARKQGRVHSLQNRSDVQIAALTREVEREQQSTKAASATRLEAVSSDVRAAYRNIQSNENRARREAQGPGTTGLALSLGSLALGSALEAA